MAEPVVKRRWRSYRFDEMALMINDRIDNPQEADVDRYVGLEHLDPESLRIRRWGAPTDVTATKLLFRKGDIIFGRRRVYQRKLAVADFDGICSAHAMVLRAKTEVVLPEFLPFFMQSDMFMERAKEISVGSLSPTINWKTLAKEEFALPPLDEQQWIAGVLRSAQQLLDGIGLLHTALVEVKQSAATTLLSDGASSAANPTAWAPRNWPSHRLAELVVPEAPICYGIVQVGENDPVGIPTVAINNLDGFESGVHRTAPFIEQRYERSRVVPGDVLVSIKGTVGIAALVPAGFTGNISRDLARLRLDPDRVLPGFFVHLWESPRFQRYIRSLVVGSTRAELSIATIRKMEIPVPPLDEQRELAEQLDLLDEASEAVDERRTGARHYLAAAVNNMLEGEPT